MLQQGPPTTLPQRGPRQIAYVLLIGVLVGIINFILMPGMLTTGDPPAWRAETQSLIAHHSFVIPPEVVHAMGGEPGQYFVRNPRNGLWYSKYGVLNGLMALPPMLVQTWMTGHVPGFFDLRMLVALNAYYVVLSSLVAMALFVITGYYTPRTWLRYGYVVMCMYGTFLWFFERSQMSEIYQVLFFLLGYWQLVKYFRFGKRRSLGLVWVWVAALVLTRLVYVILIPPIVVSVYVHDRRKVPWSLLIVGPLVIVALLGFVNFMKFGAVFASGYHQWRPWQHRMDPLRFAEGVYGFLFSIRWSIFVYFPLLFFAPLGVPTFLRRFRIEFFALSSILVVSLFCIGSIPSWRGDWTYGPRYMLFLLPALSLPALLWADDLVTRGGCRKRWLLLPLIVLGYSGYLQWQVNVAPFWTMQRLSEPLNSSNVFVWRYLEGHVEGTILIDLKRNIDHLPDSQLYQAMGGAMQGAQLDDYTMLAQRLLRLRNLYWWSGNISADAK